MYRADALHINGRRTVTLNLRPVGEMDDFKLLKATTLGIPVNEVRLTYSEVEARLSYTEDVFWAQYCKDNGYTLIDLGNPNSLKDPSAFYDGEFKIWFGK